MTLFHKELIPIVHLVDEEQLFEYSRVSGDDNPLHLDPEFAQNTIYKKPIAQGMLILAFLAEMVTNAFGLAWVTKGSIQVRFKNPVYPGDTITTEGFFKRESPDTGLLVYEVICRNQLKVSVITGEVTVPSTFIGEI
jgi:3-hydroxybutyryl-CoA dehydratase